MTPLQTKGSAAASIRKQFSSLVDAHHADETLVAVPSQDLLLQLSDSSLQSLHGGRRGLVLCYSEEREDDREIYKDGNQLSTP